jgi:hypothetical protein
MCKIININKKKKPFSFSRSDLYAFFNKEPSSEADFSAIQDTLEMNEFVVEAGEQGSS